MKLISSILLAAFLSADAFVIIPANPSSSTTSLNDVGLQWGYDERGNKKEYPLPHWSKRNDGNLRQNDWAYNPWGGISQTINSGGQSAAAAIQQEFASQNMWTATTDPKATAKKAPAPTPEATALPPSEKAQPMPDVQASAAIPDYAAQLKQMTT